MNSAFKLISGQIQKNGPISFEKFMEMALYAPNAGYYEVERSIGRGGDFFTSVSVGHIFGQLLAGRFELWQKEFGVNHILEAGAHDGQLALDILGHLPKGAFRYSILEPSEARRKIQRERLQDFDVRWIDRLEPTEGIIFSNELLDAFPVQRFGWDAGLRNWFEWGVDIQNGKLVWTKLRPAAVEGIPAELLEHLPDGFIFERAPRAERWWENAAASLQRGMLLAFDYGFELEELLQRPSGTLRAYKDHRLVEDLLANPGEQDLTAHVNFTGIKAAGERAGLETFVFERQGQFLTRVLAQLPLPEWTAAERSQFQTLTHPAHLGSKFRVLAQAKL